MLSSTRSMLIERTHSLGLLAYGALLAVALLALWVGANRTLDRASADSMPAPGTRLHAAAKRL